VLLRQRTRILRALALFALLTCVVFAAACGDDDSSGDSTSPTQASGGVPRDISATLRVATWPEWRELLVAAEQFREMYPNVEFKFQQVQQEYFDNLPQTLRSTDAPDLTAVQMEAGMGPWQEVRDQGLVADLTSVWEEARLEGAYGRDILEDAFAGDKFVSLPMHSVHAPVLYYNRTIFEKEGIEPPAGPVATPEEFDTMIAALDDAGVPVPLAPLGIAEDQGAAFLLGNFLQTACGDDEYSNLITNWQAGVEVTTDWESDCAVKAYETLKQWADEGVFGDSPETFKSAQALTLFAAGKAGIIESGSWDGMAPSWRATFPVGWFLAPPVDDAAEETTKFQITAGDGFAVPSRGDNVELAIEFVKLVASKEFQSSAAYLRAPGGSPRGDVSAPPGTPELAADMQAARADVGDVGMMLGVPYAIEIGPILARYIAGEIDLDEVGPAINARAEEERKADEKANARRAGA
jgi:ABC-type glycerol-3-phosphate transport system substrate-binding protein